MSETGLWQLTLKSGCNTRCMTRSSSTWGRRWCSRRDLSTRRAIHALRACNGNFFLVRRRELSSTTWKREGGGGREGFRLLGRGRVAVHRAAIVVDRTWLRHLVDALG